VIEAEGLEAACGCGPLLEAMRDAGARWGLPPEVAYRLAAGTFIGASTLAQRSEDPPQTLRERITSKGGTTYAALISMEAGVKAKFEETLFAVQKRAAEPGREFGK
jgi:pyrroline-5-carboxylate reductase